MALKAKVSKAELDGKLIEKAASSKIGDFVEALRDGWNGYSFIFSIGGISAILGGLFGWVGWLSVLLTVAFFYYAGRFKQKVDRERKRRKEEKEGQNHPEA